MEPLQALRYCPSGLNTALQDSTDRTSPESCSARTTKKGERFLENIQSCPTWESNTSNTGKTSTFYVLSLFDVAEAIVKNCVPCAMTNAGHSRYAPGRRLGGDRPGAYWEVDFTEVKPAKYGNKYLLVFYRYLFRMGGGLPNKKRNCQCCG
jgi:hypothetical protein